MYITPEVESLLRSLLSDKELPDVVTDAVKLVIYSRKIEDEDLKDLVNSLVSAPRREDSDEEFRVGGFINAPS